jgi:curved DNA-binding protein CbpA
MDLYEILLITKEANNDTITKAYRQLAKIHHPDKVSGSTEKFQQINYAYNILINEKTRLQYDNMNKPSKSKLMLFLENWFKENNFTKSSKFKNLFKMSDKMFEDIIENIEVYDFNDILGLFNKMIIPNKKNTSIDCSDSETISWDQDDAEYYNDLPLKYHIFNSNNIKLNLKCSIDDISNNHIRKIKIKRKQNIDSAFIETTFYFNCSHKFIVFNNGGDYDGHLIINLTLPDNYIWLNDSIYYIININLYQYIYGINIPEFKIMDWIPYKEGIIINIKYINNYIYAIKLNIIYNDTEDNKKILENIK